MSPDVSLGVPGEPHPPSSLPDPIRTAAAEKRLTIASWERLLSTEGVPIAAHAKPVLHLMGSFVRNVNALAVSKHFAIRGLQRRKRSEFFESPEHEGMADNIKLQITTDSSWGSRQSYTLNGGAEVTYSDTIALAGDFFGVPDKPISDGATPADQQARFRAAFATLDSASSAYVDGILTVVDSQAAEVNATASQSTASDRYSTAYTQVNSGKYYDAQYNGATGGANPYDITNPHNELGPYEGMYMQLAGTNWDHFGQHAVSAYSAGHAVALAQAATARQTLDENGLLRAYIIDAFACHFLADLFATGHLRTPRKALHDSSSPFPDLLAQIMHDEDNYNGMMLKSVEHSDGWLAYGDKRMLDDANATNLQYASAALQASADEIFAVWSGQSVASYAALNHIPDLGDARNRNNNNNWRPLFVVPSLDDENSGNLDATQIRVAPYDLRCDEWTTMNDWYVPSSFPIYAYYWELLPGGGVHSIEGAPPPIVASWAHKFKWAQSGRFDHGMSTKLTNIAGIATAILGTPPPAITTGDPNLNEIPQTGNTDVLYVFYRQSSTQIYCLTTNMGNVPAFTEPCTILPPDGGWQTNGIPAAIEFDGVIRLIFPDTSGRLILVTQNGSSWNAPVFLFQGQQETYKMRPSGVVALAKLGTTLYLAYRDQSGMIQYTTGDATQNTWATPSNIFVGLPVSAGTNPSITVTDGYLSVVVGGSSSSDGNAVVVYRTSINSSGQPSPLWVRYLGGLQDASNDAILVKSFAQVFSYGDAYAIAGTKPSNNNIRTIVPVHDNNPTGAWFSAYVPSATSSNGWAQTNVRVSVLFYQGNPYLFFADANAGGALTAITSATAPLHTPPGDMQ